jgi:hypothetical protein
MNNAYIYIYVILHLGVFCVEAIRVVALDRFHPEPPQPPSQIPPLIAASCYHRRHPTPGSNRCHTTPDPHRRHPRPRLQPLSPPPLMSSKPLPLIANAESRPYLRAWCLRFQSAVPIPDPRLAAPPMFLGVTSLHCRTGHPQHR